MSLPECDVDLLAVVLEAVVTVAVSGPTVQNYKSSDIY